MLFRSDEGGKWPKEVPFSKFIAKVSKTMIKAAKRVGFMECPSTVNEMTKAGFDINPGVHPIVPIMLYEASVAQDMAAALLEEGIYVIGFFYPVVAKGKARIRVQLSAAHDKEHLDKAISAFVKVGKSMKVIQ